jgi:hypothetical protein
MNEPFYSYVIIKWRQGNIYVCEMNRDISRHKVAVYQMSVRTYK